MENHATIRRIATELRLRIDSGLTDLNASDVIALALKDCGLTLEVAAAGDPSLAGALGVLNRQYRLVFVSRELDEATRCEVVAHEIGHWKVHDAPIAAVGRKYATSGVGDPVQRLDSYGVKERREAQANIFARELLLPRKLARKLFRDGCRARAMAARLGLRLETVFQQLADALLLPDVAPSLAPVASPAPKLDPSQENAARHRGEAFLLEAGPGTGKTRTLVARIAGLIAGGDAQADQILALTFSNKAAGEIADRVETAVGAAAANVWTGTFHAFGLELMRKYHEVFGKGQDPRLVDGSEAISLLEETLPVLPIVHHQNLFEPALALRDIFRGISRAKDELVGPAEYARLAEAMKSVASASGSQEAMTAAAKAAEVALVYEHYEAKLSELNAVDYGDLIMIPALRLRDDPAFADTLRDRFRWVHVDEYQDINHASAELVRGIVGDGTNLWVVGDARQSIYRFRGASTANMARFPSQFAKTKHGRLAVNYRSTKPIVDVFTRFGNGMQVSSYALPLALEPDRKDAGTPPSRSELRDPDDEMDHVAGAIRQLEKDVPLRDQAVLARSNGTLARYAEELEARGIPVLYLGPLFSRAEVRDLLSLLSLVAGGGSALLRVAGFSQYGVGVEDVMVVLETARQREQRAVEILSSLETVSGLSERGRQGLAALAGHLSNLDAGKTPWLVLMEYLFERSDYVAALLSGQAPRDDMRRVAVRQLVEAMRTMPLGGGRSPIARGLERVRHMVLLADERELRRLPDELASLDGVHLMTVHASKGLEFEAVHIPNMRAGAIPSSNRGEACPPPDGLVRATAETDSHTAEEECLFFVALSRARSHLRLYRPLTSGSRNASSSKFLQLPAMALPLQSPPAAAPRLFGRPEQLPLTVPAPPTDLTGRDLERYESCPRRFYYERVVSLRGERTDSTYLAAHGCLLKVLDEARRSTVPLDSASLSRLLDEAWQASGLIGHVFETKYRSLVDGMLASLSPILTSGGLSDMAVLTAAVSGSTITLTVDQLTNREGFPVYRSIRSGRSRASEADRLSNSLILDAVAKLHGRGGSVETFHITDGVTTVVTQTAAKKGNRLASSAGIVSAIGSGAYPPMPSDFSCPRCRFFFLCPAPVGEAG